jgi:hypothetical protein
MIDCLLLMRCTPGSDCDSLRNGQNDENSKPSRYAVTREDMADFRPIPIFIIPD